jgi:hypothetical protein
LAAGTSALTYVAIPLVDVPAFVHVGRNLMQLGAGNVHKDNLNVFLAPEQRIWGLSRPWA